SEELGHVRLDDALGRWSPERLAHFRSFASPLRSWRIELGVLALQPRLVVVRVFDLQRWLRDLQRTEAVHHHRQLVGVFAADARLGAPRMRTVRNAIRMVRDAPELDPLPTHEFARSVVEDFV